MSGEVLPEASPDPFCRRARWQVVPDVAAKLPGRGLWVAATRDAIATAVEKKLFARAAKAQVDGRRRSGRRAPKKRWWRACWAIWAWRGAPARWCWASTMCCARWTARSRPRVLIEASDGADDGKRKLYDAAHARGAEIRGDRMPDQRRIGLGPGARECDTCRRQTGRLGGTTDLRCGAPFAASAPAIGGFDARRERKRRMSDTNDTDEPSARPRRCR